MSHRELHQQRLLKFRKEQGCKCHRLLGTACLKEDVITTCCPLLLLLIFFLPEPQWFCAQLKGKSTRALCTWVLQTHKAVMLSAFVLGIKGQSLVSPHHNIWPDESKAQLCFKGFTFFQFFMVLNVFSFQSQQCTECPAACDKKSQACCCGSWSSKINQGRI